MKKLFKALAVLAACATITTVGGLMACDKDEEQQTTSTYTLTYTLSDDETYYSVTACSGSPDSVTIQSSYSGLPVTTIGSRAFYGCTSLTNITIPESITVIEYQAFYECSSLSSIVLPDSINNIGKEAFKDTAYYNNSKNWENKILYIDTYLIAAKTDLAGSVSIKNGTTFIANSAFLGCKSIESITMPDSVTEINAYAIANCYSLTEVELSNNITSISNDVFNNCTALTTVVIPDSVESIGIGAFENCRAITSLTIGKNVEVIGSYAFYGCTSLTNITVPDNVTSIGKYAFCNTAFGFTYNQLENVTFENTEGWFVTKTELSTSGTNISSADLSDTSNAATCFGTLYKEYYWYNSNI